MRKLGIVVGVLVALLIGAMLAIPLFVNVDKYRPQIVAAVNQRINGQLELGRLSLSLWGQIRIEIEGFSLKDSEGQSIVSVKDAYFHLPLLSLLTASPVIELNMDTPMVNVVKNRAGKLNVLTLARGIALPQSGAAPQVSASAKSVAVPAIVASSRLGLDLHHATIDYVDRTQGLTTQLKDLNVVARNLSLNHPSEISVWSDFDSKMGNSMSVKGPGRVDLEISPVIIGNAIQFSVDGKADFDQLEISVPGTFEKKSGVPANVQVSLSGSLGGSAQELDIEKADVRFFNAVINSGGAITGLPSKPAIRYTLKSNDIELKPWTELFPMLSQYELGGKANLSADIGGESSKLSYVAKLNVDGLTASAPTLKSRPRIDGSIVIATDQLQRLDLAMTAPGNELKITGKMLSFSAPQASFEVTSTGMDLDQLIDFQKLRTEKKAASASGLIPAAYAERMERAPTDMDALFEPLRASAQAERASVGIDVNMRMLKAEGVRMTDLTGKLYARNLAMGIQDFGVKIFGGSVKASMACQLRPRQPTYKFSAQVNGLDLGQAVQAQMAMFKNTATGKANFEIAGEGASFDPEPAKAHLKAKGSMKILDAQLSTIDVGKMAADGIMSALSNVASRVPGLAGKRFSPPSRASKYQMISSDFGISGGKFTAPNLVGKAVPRQGIDFKGNAQVNLASQSIDAKVQIIDTYDLLGAKGFQGGILCERGKPFVLPVGVGCTLQSPCYSYQDSVEFLGKVAMNNALGHVRNRVQSQVQSQVENQLKNALGGGAGSANIGKALKGLFGN